uniref:Uncharacterized protein n=1 Tax=Coccolithus braarudii TaxID=221442 RepID=A0A7S0Q3X9_9EUKA
MACRRWPAIGPQNWTDEGSQDCTASTSKAMCNGAKANNDQVVLPPKLTDAECDAAVKELNEVRLGRSGGSKHGQHPADQLERSKADSLTSFGSKDLEEMCTTCQCSVM